MNVKTEENQTTCSAAEKRSLRASNMVRNPLRTKNSRHSGQEAMKTLNHPHTLACMTCFRLYLHDVQKRRETESIEPFTFESDSIDFEYAFSIISKCNHQKATNSLNNFMDEMLNQVDVEPKYDMVSPVSDDTLDRHLSEKENVSGLEGITLHIIDEPSNNPVTPSYSNTLQQPTPMSSASTAYVSGVVLPYQQNPSLVAMQNLTEDALNPNQFQNNLVAQLSHQRNISSATSQPAAHQTTRLLQTQQQPQGSVQKPPYNSATRLTLEGGGRQSVSSTLGRPYSKGFSYAGPPDSTQ